LNFYKNNVKSCVEELIEYKKEFLEKVNNTFQKNDIFSTYGSVIFPEINHGFVKFMTNMYNVTICNNSTYHINITLPTKLDRDGKIRYRKKFIEEHMNAARGVQWIEPFLVALYGSPDIFSVLSEKFHKGSARLSFCRYVGLCNYNTEEKETILGKKLNDLDSSKVKWYNALTQGSPYIPLDTIGYDINFNKFENHGLEFRFFDWFPECYLEDIMNILVLVMDFSIRHKFKNPIRDDVWNEVCKGCVQQGNEYKLTKGIENHFIENFIPLESGTIEYNENIEVFFQSIVDMLYKHRTDISEKLSPNMSCPKIFNYNGDIWNKYKEILKV
jgi:hypothetical protein